MAQAGAAARIKLTVIQNSDGDPEFHETGPFHTSTGTIASHHVIRIRNKTDLRLRVCVRLLKAGTRIEDMFETFINVTNPTDTSGFIIVPAKEAGSDFRTAVLRLSDAAFDVSGEEKDENGEKTRTIQINVADSAVTDECTFEGEIGGTQDVIIP
jgi:hypothetical protein